MGPYSIIIDIPANAYAVVSSGCCTPKQINLTNFFVTIQLPYCVSVLLNHKSAPAKYTNIVIIWCFYKIFQENKMRLY